MKTALITGASKNIGFETAKQLTELGYFVYVGSCAPEKGMNTENMKTFQIDISDERSIDKAVVFIRGITGSLDILINIAGISENLTHSPGHNDSNISRDVFETNFFRTINVTKAFHGLLKRARKPRIINVNSGLTSCTLENESTTNHNKLSFATDNSLKFALKDFTIILAYELKGTSSRVNIVEPHNRSFGFKEHDRRSTVENAEKAIIDFATLTDIALPISFSVI